MLSGFSDERPNRSHLLGALKIEIALVPALPKSVPGIEEGVME